MTAALLFAIVRRFAGKALVVAAVGIAGWAFLFGPSLKDAVAMVVLWLVLAVPHALGFDLFGLDDSGDEADS